MSYSESEHPLLFSKILEVSEKFGIPVDVVFIVAYELLKRIPHYPGLVNSMLDSAFEMHGIDEIKDGDFVVAKLEDGILYGQIKDGVIRGKKIIESGVDASKSIKVCVVKKNILEEKWPTLVFRK